MLESNPESSTNRLHYQLIGHPRSCLDARGHKPVLTFLHGFLGSWEDWQAIAQTVSKDFCCVLIDLPGHGASLLNSDALYSMEVTAQMVVAVLAENQIHQSYLYGYSMGGRLALYLALHYPEVFPKVILESASPGLASVAEQSLRQQRDYQLADQLEQNVAEFLDKFLDNWYKQPLFHSLQQHPEFAALVQRRSRQDPRFLAKSLRWMGLGQQPNLWPQLAHCSVPIRFLAGEFDRKFIEIQTQATSLCKTASLRIVENTGHNIHFENPIVILREIAGFYSES